MHAQNFVLGLALSFSIARSAPAQAWQLRATVPLSQQSLRAAYDSQRGVVVVHDTYDCWEWDGNALAQPQPQNGGPVYDRAMAYDSQRGCTVMVYTAGYATAASPLRTREWNGSTWVVRNPPSSPSVRVAHAMAYDSIRGKTVLFGGYSLALGGFQLADTWEWDGSLWTPRFSAQWPAPMGGHVMAFDSLRGRVVMFGQPITGAAPETWEWDGVNWSLRPSAVSPPALVDCGMAFDSQRGRVVMLGHTNQPLVHQTWEWDGIVWTRRFTATSPSGDAGALAYDSQRGRVVLAVPAPAPGAWVTQVWEYFEAPASATAFGSGCGQPALSIAAANGSRPLFGSVMQTDVANAPAGIAFMAIGLSRTMIGPFVLPLPLDGFGFLGCWAYHDMALDTGQPCSPIGGGVLRHGIYIPNITALMNMPIYFQALAIAPGANPGSVIVSNALELVLGST